MSSLVGHVLPILLAGAALTGASPAVADPLAGHRWQSRVLIVAAPVEGDDRLAAQRRLYRDARRGMTERDLVLVEAVGTGSDASALRRRFRVGEGEFAAILVGKDGGEKLRAASPIPARQLFETVDEMPMRRDEMRRRPAS